MKKQVKAFSTKVPDYPESHVVTRERKPRGTKKSEEKARQEVAQAESG